MLPVLGLALYGLAAGMSAAAVPLTVMGAVAGGADLRNKARAATEGQIVELESLGTSVLSLVAENRNTKGKVLKGLFLPEEVHFLQALRLGQPIIGSQKELTPQDVILAAYDRYQSVGASLEALATL